MSEAGMYVAHCRRYYSDFTAEFETLDEAVEFAGYDGDDFYVGYITGPSGAILHDHRNPLRGWQPPLPIEDSA